MQERKRERFINLKCWGEALMQRDKEKAVYKYFEQYYGKSKQLQQAIDNLKQSNNSKLLLYGLETLYIFSKAQNMSYLFYIKQILKSVDFKKIVFQELDFLENKYQTYRRLVKMEEDKRFINYFINFIEEFMKLFTDYIYEYVQRFYKTVQIMQQEKKLQQFLEKLKSNMLEEPQIERENQLILKNQFEQFMAQQNKFKSQVEQVFGAQEQIQNEFTIQRYSFRNDSSDDNTFMDITSQKPKIISDNYLSQIKNPQSYQFQVDIQKQAIQSAYVLQQKNYTKPHNFQFRNFELQELQKIKQYEKLFPRQNSYFQPNSVTYQNLSLLPTFEELTTGQDNKIFGGTIFDLQDKEYLNIEEFLNNHFFILREDCYSGLRKAIRSLMLSKFEQISSDVLDNINLYHQVYIEDITATSQGIRMSISMKCFLKKISSLDQTKILIPGQLIILTSKSLNIMIFCQVTSSEIRVRFDRLFLSIKLIDLNVKQQLEAIQVIIQSGENLYAIENKPFYESYCYYLKCLQNKSIEQIPFQAQLIQKKKEIADATYFNSFNLYVNRTAQIQNLQDILDASQEKAILQILTKGITLIQGPPGTGKTHCGALGVKMILENLCAEDLLEEQDFNCVERYIKNMRENRKESPMLLICQTNHALDQFINHILKFCHESRIVRLGSRCQDPKLDNILFQNYKQSIRIKYDWKEFYEIRENVQEQIEKMLYMQGNICGSDIKYYLHDLANKIIQQYLTAQNLQFKQEISDVSKNLILQNWLDNQELRDDSLKQQVITNEYYNLKQISKDNIKKPFNFSDYFNEPPDDLSYVQESSRSLQNKSDTSFDDFGEFFDNEDLRSDSQDKDQEEEDEEINDFWYGRQNFQEVFNRTKYFQQKKIQDIFTKINDKNFQIWKMKKEERDILKVYIIQRKYRVDDYELLDNIYEYETELRMIKNTQNFVDQCYIATKQIVAATLTGCAKYFDILRNIKFRILFIEEAGEVLESHIVALLQKSIKNIILIGDHQQLKPHLQCYDLEQKYRANVSLFERLINNGIDLVTLQYQRRMKTKFADFIRLIYKDYKDHSSITSLNQIKVFGMKEDLLFFDHKHPEEKAEQNQSKSNLFEAEMIVQFSNYLLLNGVEGSEITILTTYSKQASIIKNSVQEQIKVSTVDDYQGEENNIIILSLVRSNDKSRLGFVAIDNRICVAFSRAKIGFYVFGNFTFIQNSIEQYLEKPQLISRVGITDLWLKIINLAEQKKVITDHFTFTCDRHDEQIMVYNVLDWKNFTGGCSKQCLQQFPCGHQCKLQCHIGEHLQKKCKEIVEKLLDCGHICKDFCGQQTFICQVLLDQDFKECNHIVQVKCYQKNIQTLCYQKCEKILQCGHNCEAMCYEDCRTLKCNKTIRVQLVCGHAKEINCCEKNQLSKLVCLEQCQKKLDCLHLGTCARNCGSCINGLNCICINKCRKILDCGHSCEQLCYEECFGCRKICEYACNCKINCSQLCHQRCLLCQNICPIQCPHSKCSKLCYEICDREPCNNRCEFYLSCGCQCMGLCGEECPKVCMESSHENEFAEKDETYYQLECQNRCIYLVEELDLYMQNQSGKLIKCRKCNSNIWASQRYQGTIKQALQKYNEWKMEKIYELEVDENKLNKLSELINNRLEYVKKNKLKDHNNFLENIKIQVKKNLNQSLNKKPLEISSQNFYCLKKQLASYEKSRMLEHFQTQNMEFNRQAIVLVKEYLLNQEFQQYYSNSLWSQIKMKLKTLFLYYEIDQYLQNQKSVLLEKILNDIERSNFLLTKLRLKNIEEILYS